jgi:REP element-mobilizing transposase RayT
MSFIDVHIHSIWATKNREPLLEKEFRSNLFEHIYYNARKKKIFIDSIGGYTDHMHSLISLSADISLSKTIQLIKGESSHWMNREKLIEKKFEWQDDYFAVSVSPDRLDTVRAYIANQEEHHRSRSFQEEVDELFKHYGLRMYADKG